MIQYEPIGDTERKEFLDQGFLLLRNVLTEDHRGRLEAATDRVYAEETASGRGRPDGTVHLLGFVTRDELFGDLLTHPDTFRYVWGLLGWNIYTHHNHLDVTPPAAGPEPSYWGWHQDGYRQNSDPETLDPAVPRPMLSLKVGYVLSDLSQPGRGATHTANHWGIGWDGYIDEQIPLRRELRTRGLLDRTIPWLR